ncbi:MAG: elongation factor P [Candidatus Caldipriscus sp.]|nr:elongation factor P [Candidatus Caldipriscus sp.]
MALRVGSVIRYEGEEYIVLEYQHSHRGRGGAIISLKVKNLRTGQVQTFTLRDTDKIEDVMVEKKPAVFSYVDGDYYHFLDSETYEDITFHKGDLGDMIYYLKEGLEVLILYADNRPVSIELPTYVELKVVEAPPGVRGNTAQGGSKPVKLETGLVVNVPLFIEEGDVIKVDTRTGEYIGRA